MYLLLCSLGLMVCYPTEAPVNCGLEKPLLNIGLKYLSDSFQNDSIRFSGARMRSTLMFLSA